MLPVERGSSQGFRQLRSMLEGFGSLSIGHPAAIPLVFLGPVGSLGGDGDLVELVEGLGRIFGELLGRPRFQDLAKIVFDSAHNTSLFPGLALRSFGARLVVFPAAFGKHPARASRGLDQEDMRLLCIEGHDAGDEALAFLAVACGKSSELSAAVGDRPVAEG